MPLEPSAPKVAIIDYGMGNLFSVRNACLRLGMDAMITADKSDILAADAAILPGVGAFGEAMASLEKLDLAAVIADCIASGKPFLGVCLGLQLLFEESEEFGSHRGLGLIPGVVRRFPASSASCPRIRIPHIGWNRIRLPAGRDSWAGTPLDGVAPGEYMYFVHSYFVAPADPGLILCTTEYEGVEYCSGVRKGNLFAAQFHPEKSAVEGLRIYGNLHQRIRNRSPA